MLLSQANLHVLSNSRDHQHIDIEKLKLERIKSFIDDQRINVLNYKSPNRHHPNSNNNSEQDNSSIDPLYDDDQDDTSLFSSSISQIIARRHYDKQSQAIRRSPLKEKTRLQKQIDSKSSPSVSIKHKRQQSLSSLHQHSHGRRRHKTKTSNEDDRKPEIQILPQTNAHGFHLLQKFVSPNLEINRITIRSNNNHRRPKLGLFNKGKSSAKATKPVPDLVFSETKFLKPDRQPSNERTCTSCDPSFHNGSIQPSISKFFEKQQPVNQKPQSPYVENKSSSSTPPKNPLSILQLNNMNTTFKNNNKVAEQCDTRNRSIVEVSSSYSNQSIERVLRECKDAPQVSLNYNRFEHQREPFDDYYHYDNGERPEQLPTYARVKTPTSNIILEQQHYGRSRPNLIESSLGDVKSSYLGLMKYDNEYIKNEITTAPPSEATLLVFYKNHLYYDNNSNIQEQPEEQQQVRKDVVFDSLVNWQIESIASFDSAGNEESINQYCYDNNVANFWQYQYKRAL